MKIQTSFRIEDATRDRLKLLAAVTKETAGEVLDRLVDVEWKARQGEIARAVSA